MGASRPQYFSDLRESWSTVNHSPRELATVFSVTFFLVTIVGQLVKTPPPKEGVSAHHLGVQHLPQHLACLQICITSIVPVNVVLLIKLEGSLLSRQIWLKGNLLSSILIRTGLKIIIINMFNSNNYNN